VDKNTNNRKKKIENPDEFLFNSVLRDYLRRNHPPSFGPKILSELASREIPSKDIVNEHLGMGGLNLSHAELDEALGAAQADLDYSIISPPVQTQQQPQQREKSYRLEPYFWEYRSVARVAGLLSLAATVALGVIGYRIWDTTKTGNDLVKVQSNLPSIPLPADVVAEKKSEIDATTGAVAVAPPQANDFPAEEKTPIAPKVLHLAKPTRNVFVQPEALEPNKLADVINSQLRQIWKRHGVEPKLVRDNDELWLIRATEGILGRAPTITESELFRQEKGSDRHAKTVQNLLQSEEFHRHWSRLITENFLTQPITSTSRRELSMLVEWVDAQLVQGTPIGQIERYLVEVGFGENDPDRLAKLSAFDDARRRLISIENEMRGADKFLLMRANNRDTSYVHLANNILYATGNGTASCVQCHSSESPVMQTITTPDSEIAGQFWNFAAAVKVVSRSREKPNAELAKEDLELFYDAMDGSLQLATPRIAVTDRILDTALGSDKGVTIHEWIEQSHDARNGLVEAIWTKMLQQPLVPPFKLTEDEAESERRDLKDLLAKQLQATGDIKVIVQSIVLSDAFFVPEAKLTKTWYLTSSDAKLSQYHKGSRLFAFVPVNTTRLSIHRPQSTTLIAKWMEAEKRRGGNSAALAQASPKNAVLNSATSSLVDSDDIDQVRFLVSSTRPYYGLERLANQLSESSLDWNDKVNHLYLLIKGRYPMQSERFDANYTLELAQQDHYKAIIYICTSHLGSF